MILTQADIDRFWSFVGVRGSDECWEWIGFCSRGYGRFGLNGESKRAHRVAFVIANGQIPELFEQLPAYICHKCDNRKCCNPAHLFLGNHLVNQKDSVVKNRHRTLNQKGENNSSALKTENQVREVKVDLKEGILNQRQIVEKHGLSTSAMSLIKIGRTWSHVK